MCGGVYEVVKCGLTNGMEQKRKKKKRRTLKMRKTMRMAKKGERSEAPQNLDRKKRQQLKEGVNIKKRLRKRTLKVFFPFVCPFPTLSPSPVAVVAGVAPAVIAAIVVVVVVDVAAAVASVSPAAPDPSAVSH
jgi:hypothetical protein